MKMVRLALLSILAGSAAMAAERASEETVIPFLSSIGSLEWKPASDKALYVRGGNGSWYFVRTTNRCTRLLASRAIGFDASALDQLDRHGAILVQGQRCPVASITRSDGPPKKARRKAG